MSLGINSGFLYSLGNHSYLYQGSHPEGNKKLETAIQDTDAVVLLELEYSQLEEALRPLLSTYSELLKSSGAPEVLSDLERRLSAFVENFTLPEKFEGLEGLLKKTPETTTKILIQCLKLLCHFGEKAKDRFSYTLEPWLIEKGQAQGKEIVRLFEENPELSPIYQQLEGLGVFLKSPLARVLIEFLATEKGMNSLVEYTSFTFDNERVGQSLNHEIDIFSFLDDATRSKLLELTALAPEEKAKDLLLESQYKEMRGAYVKNVADKISSLVETKKRCLFAMNMDYLNHHDLLSALRTTQVVEGPLKTELKPRGLLWKVTGPDGKSGHLLGSIHYVMPGLLHLNSGIQEAFDKSGVLAVESNVNEKDVSQDLKNEMEALYLKELATMTDLEKMRLRELLMSELPGNLNLDGSEFDSIPHDMILPMLLNSLMSQTMLEYRFVHGMDHHFMEQAEKAAKPILALESHSTHVDAIQEVIIPSKELVALSKGTLEERKASLKERKQNLALGLYRVCSMWENGLVKELELLYQKAPSTPAQKRKLAKRNVEMADTFDRLVREEKNPFGVMGGFHMAGDCSVLGYLTDLGYKVEQIVKEEEV